MKRFAIPFYPLLLGIIWVLLTYSANKELLTSPKTMLIPMLVVTGIIAAIWGITQLIVKDWKKSALIVAIIFLLTIFHGYIRDYTKIAGIRMVPIWLGLMAIGIFTIVKVTKPKGRINLTVVGNVFCVGVLCAGLFFTLSQPVLTNASNSKAVTINNYHNPMPDVYYIIPDTYTSNYVLSNYLDYDNNEFTDFLRSRNFTVVDKSFANYHHSILSISSVMNMKYWTDAELGDSPSKVLGSHLYQNPVGDTFKAANYTYVQIGSWWGFTSTNKVADITYQFSSLSELDFTLYGLTLWYNLLDYLFDAGGNRILREAHLSQFEHLVKVSKMEGPTFTFCHLILPHGPFLFDANGNPVSDTTLTPEEWQIAYLEQLTYTNKLLTEAIDEILSNSEVTPIIIICADEGYSDPAWQEYLDSKKGLQTIVEDEPELVVKRQGSFFAILNPYGSIPSSPVNVFRCVFNTLFNSQLEYLPDLYFLKNLGKYEHRFIEITEFIDG